MPCPRCKTLCTTRDFTESEVVYDIGFGREARNKVCGACLVEVKGGLVFSKITTTVRPR